MENKGQEKMVKKATIESIRKELRWVGRGSSDKEADDEVQSVFRNGTLIKLNRKDYSLKRLVVEVVRVQIRDLWTLRKAKQWY